MPPRHPLFALWDMQKNIVTIVMSVATVLACAVFASTFVRASLYSPPEEEILPAQAGVAATTPATPSSIPARLVIPAIAVDAPVQDVGIGKSGNMAVPSNYSNVGWYRWGPTPGEQGSAVINGHVDNGFGMDAVFKNISKLSPGDSVYIEQKDGTRVAFVVEKVATYMVKDVPLEELFHASDAARLNLITCAGAWDPENEMYDERVVVYAVRV